MKPKKVRTVLIISFLFISGINFDNSLISSSRDYEGRRLEYSSLLMTVDPIVIDGNMGFMNAAVNESWVTLKNGVYVIENLVIQGSDQVSCIVIKNSNMPFRIENCRLYNAGGNVVWYPGLKLDNVSNGQIIGNTIINNQDNGIMIQNSDNITLTENEVSNNEDWGIIIYNFCTNITLFNNILDHNEGGILKRFTI